MEFEVTDSFFSQNKIDKGLMTLVDEDRQNSLLDSLGGDAVKKQCGGSAANSVIAVAQFGGKSFYSCKVANDPTGDFYFNDLIESGVATNLSVQKRAHGTTGKCLVMITPDAQRTMNTYLGITGSFSKAELDEAAIKDSQYLYIEGYLVPSPTGLEAAVEAKRIADANGVKTALTLSDINMVKYFKENLSLIIGKGVDLLFANESEAMAYAETEDLMVARESLKKIARTFVITRGEHGAMVFDGEKFIDIEPFKVNAIDSNGAGDMFAGAFLYALTHNHTHASAGKLASMAASRVVGQYGPRLKWHQTQEVKNLVLGV